MTVCVRAPAYTSDFPLSIKGENTGCVILEPSSNYTVSLTSTTQLHAYNNKNNEKFIHGAHFIVDSPQIQDKKYISCIKTIKYKLVTPMWDKFIIRIVWWSK